MRLSASKGSQVAGRIPVSSGLSASIPRLHTFAERFCPRIVTAPIAQIARVSIVNPESLPDRIVLTLASIAHDEAVF